MNVCVCFDFNFNSPKRNSPKFPHPIFLPTRKFGPTISTPDDELTECRVEYILVLVPPVVLPTPVPPPPPPPPVLIAWVADVAGTPLWNGNKKSILLVGAVSYCKQIQFQKASLSIDSVIFGTITYSLSLSDSFHSNHSTLDV